MDITPYPGTRLAPTRQLDIRTRFAGDVALLTLAGELDHWSGAELADTVDAVRLAGVTSVVVDAAGITFLDCGGLSTLEAIATHLRGHDCQLRICQPSRAVRRLVGLLGVRDLLD